MDTGETKEGIAGALTLKLAAESRLSLRDHVRRQLRIAIVSGRFKEGEKLNERALAEELDVSTTPLKEALRQLEVEGLVEVQPRRGLVVRFGQSFAEEMILARASLERPIAELAARRISASSGKQLMGIILSMEQATQRMDIAELIALNEVFHGAIHSVSGSVHLRRMVDLQQFYDDSARRVIHRNKGESNQALKEHRSICEAIVAGNPEMAGSHMEAHVLRSGRLYLMSVFGNQGDNIVIEQSQY